MGSCCRQSTHSHSQIPRVSADVALAALDVLKTSGNVRLFEGEKKTGEEARALPGERVTMLFHLFNSSPNPARRRIVLVGADSSPFFEQDIPVPPNQFGVAQGSFNMLNVDVPFHVLVYDGPMLTHTSEQFAVYAKG